MLGEPPTAVLSFLGMCEDLLLERVDAGRQRSSSTSCYNPTGWITITCMFLERVSTSRSTRCCKKDSKQALASRRFPTCSLIREALRVANISPLTAIDTFSGARNGKIKADFYDDCQDIPDPCALDPMQKNLLLLDDCFLRKQNKAEAYYIRGRHNNCETIYIAQNYFRLPRYTVRENSNFIILFPQDVKNLTHIHADHCASDIPLSEFKQFCHGVWSAGGAGHNFVTIDLTSTPMNGKYRQNFNRFYFSVNCK